MSTCFRPVKAWYGNKLASGKREIVFSSGQAQSCLDLALPCNNCIGCHLEKARQWAMRCVDEASLYKENSFITLTVDDAHMKEHGRSLDHRNFQLFMKRLRKFTGGQMIRFFMCGEYGERFGRPHYHALLFNLGFPDRVYLKTTKSGEKIYTSKSLEANWSLGFSSVGDVTFGSAAYVARYHVKKAGGVVARDHYLDKMTGEILAPEYVRMSRGCKARKTGGLGKGWFQKFKSDVYPRDSRVIKGVDTKPCKFYDSLYEAEEPEAHRQVKLRRIHAVSRQDNTPERLEVKEKVKLAQISSLKNSMEEI